MWLIVTKIQFRLGMIIGNLKDAIHSSKSGLSMSSLSTPSILRLQTMCTCLHMALSFLLFPTEIGRVYSFSLKMIDINTLSSAFISKPLKEYQ